MRRGAAYINVQLHSRLHHRLNFADCRLQGYSEGRLSFAPTFKLEPGTGRYSSRRAPSWTDRVLWKTRTPNQPDTTGGGSGGEGDGGGGGIGGAGGGSKAPACAVRQAYYSSVPEVLSSDHRPVVAGFEVALGPAAALWLRRTRSGGTGGDGGGGDDAGSEEGRAKSVGCCGVM